MHACSCIERSSRAPNAPPDPGQDQPDLIGREPEPRRHLVAVDVQVLRRDVQVDPALPVGHREPGLRAEERLVLATDVVRAADHDRPGRARVPVEDVDRAQVVAAGVDRRRARRERGDRVDDRLLDLVVDRDARGGRAGGVGVVGGDERDRLAVVSDAVDGQHRLVGQRRCR